MKTHRVWIELEVPTSEDEAKEIAELATNMLKRLSAADDSDDSSFFWMDNKWNYGGHSGYYTLSDHGHWFNLDYFGRK